MVSAPIQECVFTLQLIKRLNKQDEAQGTYELAVTGVCYLTEKCAINIVVRQVNQFVYSFP